MNTKIKLCGLKSVKDIEMVNRLKPDYVGFVMWEHSHRNITRDELVTFKGMLDKDIKAVGVFVDEDVYLIASLINDGLIDIAQLHGSEDNDYIDTLRNLTDNKAVIFKAFKTDAVSIENARKSHGDFLLFDPGKGDGMTFSWEIIKNFERPYFLAGGLNSDNVTDAIKFLHPYGVDVSSGIETDKIKDPYKAEMFVRKVRSLDL